MANATNRRNQAPKSRGKKSYIKTDTAVARAPRFNRSDRRNGKVSVRDYR